MFIHKKLAFQTSRGLSIFMDFVNFKITPLSWQHCLKRAKEEKNHFISDFHFLNITLTKCKKKRVN